MDQAENLRQKAKAYKEERQRATTVTVTSGKGGTGKTSFSVNFAIALSQMGKRVILIDSDFGLSNVDVMLGVQTKYNLSHVISGAIDIQSAINKGYGNISFIAGGSGIDTLISMKKREFNTALKQIMSLDESYDYIIFDSAAGVSDTVLRLVENSDESILVVNPEPTAVMDAFVLMKSVATSSRKPSVRIVMNRVETPMEGLAMSRNLKNIVIKYLDYEMNYIGSICNDKEFVKAVKERVPLMIRYPGSRAARDIERVAAAFIQTEPVENGGGLKRLLDRIMQYGSSLTKE